MKRFKNFLDFFPLFTWNGLILFGAMGLLMVCSTISFAANVGPEKEGGPRDEPLFLLQTEIIGNVMNPRVPYQIPWRSPESIEQGDIWVTRRGINNLFIPLEPEKFEQALGLKNKGGKPPTPKEGFNPLQLNEVE